MWVKSLDLAAFELQPEEVVAESFGLSWLPAVAVCREESNSACKMKTSKWGKYYRTNFIYKHNKCKRVVK